MSEPGNTRSEAPCLGRWSAGVLVVSTVLVGLTAAQMVAAGAYQGESVAWSLAVVASAITVYPWTALSPLIGWIVHRWPVEHGRLVGRSLLLAALALALTASKIRVEAVLDAWVTGRPRAGSIFEVYLNLLVVAALFAGAHWWRHLIRLRRTRDDAARLEVELSRARLAALEERLRPHFLFNALNTVSALMREDVDRADRTLQSLGDLLRMSLDRESPEVPFAEELEFARRYLDIERARLEERMRVDWDVDPDTLSVPVPSLVLQPLVENAVKHAVAVRSTPTAIGIRASVVRVDGAGGILQVVVSDDGPGPTPGAPDGVGLRTTRSRLRARYGDLAILELEAGPVSGARARLEIPTA